MTRDEFVITHWETYTANQIADELGVCVGTVRNIAKRLGLRKASRPFAPGTIFGKVVVEEYIGSNADGRRVYRCRCECGKEAILASYQLTDNQQPSCNNCKLTVAVDLAGKEYGRLTAIQPIRERKSGQIVWECKCECGNTTFVRAACLTNGHTRSCGCLQRDVVSKDHLDWIGKKYGRLTIVKRVGHKWLCRCDCGNETLVRSNCIADGRTKSCGCFRVENISGPKCRFWRGGVTEEQRGIRGISAYFTWGKHVKKRDGYVCQKCGVSAGEVDKKEIHAHHVKNFIDALDEALDIDNGITLCEECHKSFHKQYGKRHNTELQLKEFLNGSTTRTDRFLHLE